MYQLNFKDWTAWVTPEDGMNTVRLTLEGQDVLRKAEKDDLYKTTCAHALPLLLPPNRVDQGHFEFEGEEYQLPINHPAMQNHCHGFLWEATFTVTKQSESQICAKYENKGEIFPFPFLIEVDYRLDEDGYYQEFRITNTGKRNMPLTFGLHTNFYERGEFAIPLGERYEVNDRFIPTGKMCPLTDRQKEYCTGAKMDTYKVDGFYTATGHTASVGNIEYVVSENFNHWTLYNGGGNMNFISMEPQCGAVNGLNSKIGLITLAPGKTEVFHTRIRKKQ